ncbi:MAG: cystathionine beta-lyase, partial [Hyphomicrobiales bacterium]
MSKSRPDAGKLTDATLSTLAGRDPGENYGMVNPPVYHASTVLYPSAADLEARRGRYHYGRRGTPT